MNAVSTNKLKGNIQSLRKCSQTDLHVKILNLVANRMNPVSSDLGLEKQACGSCTSYLPGSSNSTKRHSLATTRAKQGKKQCNKTICEGNQPNYNKNNVNHQNRFDHLHRELSKKNKRKLQIIGKVISLSIDNTKIGDFTIDLRRQIPTQFVNIKMMNKLKLENADKSRKISQLEHQIVELQQKVIELSFNLSNKSKVFSEKSIPPWHSINKISSIHDTNNNQSKQTQIWIDLQQQTRSQSGKQKVFGYKKQCYQYDFLLRILKNQAIQLQRCKFINEKDKKQSKKL